MPQLGESIAEATFVHLPFKPGDEITADQEIIEVETQKASMGVTAPCGGSIAEICVRLSLSPSAGKQAIFRAVKKLRRVLEPLVGRQEARSYETSR